MTPTMLKKLRKKHKLTQTTLAQLSGYSVESITKLENGRMPFTERAKKIFKIVVDLL